MPEENWKRLLAESITTADQLSGVFALTDGRQSAVREVARRYPMRISPYYLSLISQTDDPIWRQAVPDGRELLDSGGLADPLAEERFSPLPNLTHRYPDRVLFLVSNACGLYCRFCTRKRKIGKNFPVNEHTLSEGLAYIRAHRTIRDVLVSGGDPLLLDDEPLADILNGLRSIPHVEIIRIGTRVPCVLPQRVTPKLAATLARFHPVYINTHFNHPKEITREAARACALLSDAGIPLGCQTVLLKGVNDSPGTMTDLMRRLLTIRVRPYYLHHLDLTSGTAHFGTPLRAGIDILNALRGHTSGMCVPHYVIDLPGGGGKVPLVPDHIVGLEHHDLLLRNYQGNVFRYRVSAEDARALAGEKGRRAFRVNG